MLDVNQNTFSVRQDTLHVYPAHVLWSRVKACNAGSLLPVILVFVG